MAQRVDAETLWAWVADSELAFQIGATWWFPLLESIHVLAVTFMVGCVLVVDLRLLGWTARSESLPRMTAELVPWAWSAAVPAVLTGLALFISRPAAYAANPALQLKLLALLLLALNVFYYHRGLLPRLCARGTSPEGHLHVRLVGGTSLLLWLATLLAGRWIGHLN